MSTSNGHRHRLRRIEDGQQPPPVDAEEEELDRWRTAWNKAVREIIATMVPVHIAGMAEDFEAHEHPARSRPWGRLRCEVQSRIGAKVGHFAGAMPWYPDSPLALVPAVAEAILAGPPNLNEHGLRCYACGYLLPTAFEWIDIECDEDGRWHDRHTGIPCAGPIYPTDTERRGRYHKIELFTACPLCGYSDLVSTVNDRAPEMVWA